MAPSTIFQPKVIFPEDDGPMAFHITGTPILSISTRIEKQDPKIWKQYREYVGI